MTYEYKCSCGAELKIHTDSKPPKSIKCYHCKKKALLKEIESIETSEEKEEDS